MLAPRFLRLAVPVSPLLPRLLMGAKLDRRREVDTVVDKRSWFGSESPNRALVKSESLNFREVADNQRVGQWEDGDDAVSWLRCSK